MNSGSFAIIVDGGLAVCRHRHSRAPSSYLSAVHPILSALFSFSSPESNLSLLPFFPSLFRPHLWAKPRKASTFYLDPSSPQQVLGRVEAAGDPAFPSETTTTAPATTADAVAFRSLLRNDVDLHPISSHGGLASSPPAVISNPDSENARQAITTAGDVDQKVLSEDTSDGNAVDGGLGEGSRTLRMHPESGIDDRFQCPSVDEMRRKFDATTTTMTTTTTTEDSRNHSFSTESSSRVTDSEDDSSGLDSFSSRSFIVGSDPTTPAGASFLHHSPLIQKNQESRGKYRATHSFARTTDSLASSTKNSLN